MPSQSSPKKTGWQNAGPNYPGLNLDQTIDNTLYRHDTYIISELVDMEVEWGEAGGDVKIGACFFNASVRTSFFHRPLIEK